MLHKKRGGEKMTNIIDYVKKYGNKSFLDLEFNDLDAAIFSLLSYIDFYNIVPSKKREISLKNALDYFLTFYDLKKFIKHGFSRRELLTLCKLIKDKERYKDIKLLNYIYKIDWQEQFGALTLKLPNGITVVSFEGTDHTLAGWEEDFTMSYKFPVSCETTAIKYLNNISIFTKQLIIVGHSKGGHLSIVASMFANPLIKMKIKKVYNFDGPGLRSNIIKSHKYHSISKKLSHIIPDHSIIGLLLRHNSNLTVVSSTRKDFYAHSIFNWQTEKTKFKTSKLSHLSANLDKSIILWLDEHNDYERENIVKNLFEYLRKNGITDVTKLVKLKTLFTLIKNRKDLDKETKNVLANFIKFNYDYHVNNKQNTIE